jgi:DNA invertase Pin-like site-specific DNA recombinase
MLHKRGVGFKDLTGADIDTTTSQGKKLMFTMFGALAEFECDVIRERIIAGLAAARARGRKGGREPVPLHTLQASPGSSGHGEP